jgi:two-component system LytT family sensor kinase
MHNSENYKIQRVSPAIIWSSSILMGVLASVPKIAERHFNTAEALVNSSITALFALFVWYYNIYTMPAYTSRDKARGFSILRLMLSLLIGLGVMFILAYVQQLLLSHMDFGPTMLMVEVRGILINLTFYMFLHLVYQGYQNQQVGIELERSKADNLGAQYEMLKQQVNPHFLFNNMNTLKAMVETNDKHTIEFILKLSDFYRFTLESRKHDLIHLSEELEILTAYMFLLKARFEEGINLVNTIEPKFFNSLIPPFTIQLLIENCIKHNVVSLDKPLEIRIYTEDNKIVVENKVQLKKTQEISTKVGLENINLRYIHLLNEKVDIENNDKLFKVKLPVINEHHNH